MVHGLLSRSAQVFPTEPQAPVTQGIECGPSKSEAACSNQAGGAEEWRPIVGYEGWYEVSDLGRVRRGKRILRDAAHPRGYRKVDLSRNGKASTKNVHRLVAEAFLGKALARQVNHRNGNKADNRSANLEWCSASRNIKHSYELHPYDIRARRVTPAGGVRRVERLALSVALVGGAS